MFLHIGINGQSMTLSNFCMGVSVIAGFTVGAVVRLTFWFWEDEALKMMNGFLDFEKKLYKRYSQMDKKGTTFTKLVFIMGSGSTGLMGLLTFFLLLSSPCIAPYSGSMTPQCLAGKPESLTLAMRAVIGIFDGMMYQIVAPPTALLLAQIFYGFCLSLQKYISFLSRATAELRSSGDNILEIFGFYQQLQLLENQVNITCRAFFVPVGLSVSCTAFIFSLYVCIKLHSSIPMPGFAFFPLILIDWALVIMVDFASGGGVYAKSKALLSDWRKSTRYFKKSKGRVKAKSFSTLKIRFGMNFIVELTSLSILDFCLNQTVSLILMS